MAQFAITGTKSCGIYELVDISRLPTAEAVVKEVARRDWDYSYPAFLYFSGVVGERKRVYQDYNHANRADDYGQTLADYITTNKLGVVTETPLAKNHNGNMLRVWVWAPDWMALKALSTSPSLAVNAPAAPLIVPVAYNYITDTTSNDSPF